HNRSVAGSIPAGPTLLRRAQPGEQRRAVTCEDRLHDELVLVGQPRSAGAVGSVTPPTTIDRMSGLGVGPLDRDDSSSVIRTDVRIGDR
ncbi:MAG: hypothetical protein S0880_36650, partial [Actinomycetota bacterium]|nr:hypothetical protein [Actinomycetota bacterium]